MGIDFPTKEELLVYQICGVTHNLAKINKRIAREIGVNFLGYNDIDGLSKGIDLPKNQLCLTCTTGDYSCLKQWPKFRSRKEIRS
jgi:amidophosphoribosyltransferase